MSKSKAKQQTPTEHPSSKLSGRTIIRAAHDRDNPYFIMRRDAAQDDSLTFESRGLLAYVLSKSDNWKVRLRDLMREGDVGLYVIRRLLRELERAGYLTRERTRSSGGRFDWLVTIHEQPRSSKKASNTPQVNNPPMDNPSADNPSADNPSADNQPIYKSKSQKKKEVRERDKDIKKVSVGRGAENAPRLPRSRYEKSAIRRYVDSIGDYVNNPGGFTHSLWLSGDADEDVASYLKRDEDWQERASKKGIEIVLKGWPHWSKDKNFKSWEAEITATVVGYFELWERALEEIRQKQINPFPMEAALQTYSTLVASELAGASSNAA
jgi:hypothetical protein